jgi:FkbM family methyltransferase
LDTKIESRLAPVASSLQQVIAQALGTMRAVNGDARPLEAQEVQDLYVECFARIWAASGEPEDRRPAAAIAAAALAGQRAPGSVGPTAGVNPLMDMAQLMRADARPVIFDVGANIGQSVRKFRNRFPTSLIHSFEPIPDTFRVLESNTEPYDDVVVTHALVGAQTGTQEIIENTDSTMSSVLELGPSSWGKERARHPVPVITVDDYCDDHAIDTIDVLKIDTQGYELEVLKGAARMLERGAIHLVYLEVIFSKMYDGMPTFDQIYKLFMDRRYALVGMYEFHYRDGRAGWTDALFVHDPV